jgi:hypothetical protein
MFNRYEPRQLYERRYNDGEKPVTVPVTDHGGTLAEAVECIYRDAKDLADKLAKQATYIGRRHQLASEMARQEAGARTPIKMLETRVALLNQINSFDQEIKAFTNEELKERIALIERIKRLEPGETAPLEELRERARLIERVEAAEDKHPDSNTRDVT